MAWWQWGLALLAIPLAIGIVQGIREELGKKPAPAALRPAPVTARDELPAPIADRIGHVGGIESITVDGRRWYFGFDYRNDLVVSPLIDDADAMARFASRHMEQRTEARRHDVAYWRALVDESVKHSELSSAPENNKFAGSQLSGIARTLRSVAADAEPVDGFSISYELRYLLGAACGWCGVQGDEYPALLKRLDIEDGEPEWIEQLCIDIVSGAESADDASRVDAATLLRLRLDAWLDQAPANVREVFAPLRSY